MSPSVFERIIQGDIAAEFLHDDEYCVAIRDAHPQAPVHFLVIPKKPLVSLQDAKKEDQALLGHLLLIAAKIAEQEGLDQGYRLLANNGRPAGQTVMHLHFHVLGGRRYQEAGLNRQ